MSTTPQATPEPNELATAAAPISNLRKAATGVIPKQMQSWIFLTVIFVAAVGLWFSSGSTKVAKSNHGTAASAADQVKPVIGGLSPEEVQRASEKPRPPAEMRRPLHIQSAANHHVQFKEIFGNQNKPSDDTKNPKTEPRDPLPRRSANGNMLDVSLPMLRCHIAPIPAPEFPAHKRRLRPFL